MSGVVHVNGHPVAVPQPGARLLDWLRDIAGETGPKEGCAMGHCGACTVLVAGRPVLSCCTLVHAVLDAEVWTSAGLVETPIGRALQDTFDEHGAFQCGFCAPGMTVAATAWLSTEHGAPSRSTAARALCGNVCRCGGYGAVLDAVLDVASKGQEKA